MNFEETCDDEANNIIDDLRWNMRRAGISTKEQADLLHCSVQNINRHYRNRSFTVKQYILLKTLYQLYQTKISLKED